MESNTFQVNLSVIVFNSKGEVLLIKRSLDEEVYPGLWGIPGGKLDSADKNLEEGLAREVKEETGILINKDLKLISNNVFVSPENNKVYLVFTAKYESGEPKPLEDTEEVRWFGHEELPPKEDFTPFTFDLISKAIKSLNI